MVISRTTFFVALFFILITPFVVHKIFWLVHSTKTNGIVRFEGRSYTGQIAHVYSVITFFVGKDTVWFNGTDNILFKDGEVVPIRYLAANPADAKIDVFAAIWGDTLVYAGVPVLILLLVFVHPDVVPRGSRFRLMAKKPFCRMVSSVL